MEVLKETVATRKAPYTGADESQGRDHLCWKSRLAVATEKAPALKVDSKGGVRAGASASRARREHPR